MRCLLPVVIASSLVFGTNLIAYGQGNGNLQQMFRDLTKPETSDNAAAQLRSAVKDNSVVHQFLAANAAQLISTSGLGPVRLNVMRLAGDFKVQEAIPALVEQLGDERSTGGPVTMAEALRLENDPPGKALAQIGEPAIPAVKYLLNSPARSTRFRAVYILWNIGSEQAKTTLRGQFDRENDPGIRQFIQKSLGTQ